MYQDEIWKKLSIKDYQKEDTRIEPKIELCYDYYSVEFEINVWDKKSGYCDTLKDINLIIQSRPFRPISGFIYLKKYDKTIKYNVYCKEKKFFEFLESLVSLLSKNYTILEQEINDLCINFYNCIIKYGAIGVCTEPKFKSEDIEREE